MQFDKEYIASVHEAAHAVICLKYKVPFKYVTIVPKEGSIGHLLMDNEFTSVIHDYSLMSESKRNERFYKYLICLLAGYVAEEKIGSEDSTDHAKKDFETAFSLCGKFFGSMRTTNSYLQFVLCSVKDEFSFCPNGDEDNQVDTELWELVLILAEELRKHKKLGYSDCKRLYNLHD